MVLTPSHSDSDLSLHSSFFSFYFSFTLQRRQRSGSVPFIVPLFQSRPVRLLLISHRHRLSFHSIPFKIYLDSILNEERKKTAPLSFCISFVFLLFRHQPLILGRKDSSSRFQTHRILFTFWIWKQNQRIGAEDLHCRKRFNKYLKKKVEINAKRLIS